jgi:hypothetical protein
VADVNRKAKWLKNALAKLCEEVIPANLRGPRHG